MTACPILADDGFLQGELITMPHDKIKENLPAELIQLKQWLIWYQKPQGDRVTKIPCAPWATGHWGAANAKDPDNWTDFDAALSYAKQRDGYGVGFCFKENGGIVGIDLDHSIDLYGVASKLASDIVKKAHGYAELSPSKKGIHVYVKGELYENIRNTEKGIEAYDRDRFFTVTGLRLKDAPFAINEAPELLSELADRFGEKHIKIAKAPSSGGKKYDIPWEKIVPLDSLHEVGHRLQGPHPIHGSEQTGNNFAIDLEKNLWFCYRHWCGGDQLSLLAQKEGILSCNECAPGALTGEKFKQVKVRAIALGLLPPDKESIQPGGLPEGVLDASLIEEPDFIAEEIYDNDNGARFAVWDGKQIDFVSEIKVGALRYIPILDDAVLAGAVVLPSAVQAFTSVDDLVKEVKAFIHEYVEVSPAFEQFAAWYVLLTWVYDRLNTLSYLRYMGDTGTGKSRGQDAVGQICYKPIFASGAVTAAPIYRMIKRWGGTLVIDEADWKNTDEQDEVVKILNCGFERNRPVLRCTKENPDVVQVLPVFGPKVLSTRRPFYDPALESRCLTEVMQPKTREDIPLVLPREFYEKAAKLRNKLLMFRFKYRPLIDSDAAFDIEFKGIEDRIRQATMSFAVLFAKIPEMVVQFKKFLEAYQLEVVKARADSYEGIVLDALFNLRLKGEKNISAGDITNYLKNECGDKDAKAQRIGRTLAGLHIERISKRIGDRVTNVIEWDDAQMQKLGLKYVPDFKNNYAKLIAELVRVKFTTDIDTGDESQPNLSTLERILGPRKQYTKGATCDLQPEDANTLILWGYAKGVAKDA
jgi:hypothetical protein